jgi:hypothetical protein
MQIVICLQRLDSPALRAAKNFEKGRARAIFREGAFRRFSFKGGAFFLFLLSSFLLLASSLVNSHDSNIEDISQLALFAPLKLNSYRLI